VIKESQMIDETFEGLIGRKLSEVVKIHSFNSEKKRLVAALKEACIEENYIIFDGYSHHLKAGKIGQSFLYNLPSNTRGRLKVFAGSVIRVICIGSGQRWARKYAVGIVK